MPPLSKTAEVRQLSQSCRQLILEMVRAGRLSCGRFGASDGRREGSQAHPLSNQARMLRCMNFWPTSNDYRPCWHCIQFAGMLYAGSAAACTSPGGPRVRSMPGGGCVNWERQPGADDEPGPPGGQEVLPSKPRLPPGPRPGASVRMQGTAPLRPLSRAATNPRGCRP